MMWNWTGFRLLLFGWYLISIPLRIWFFQGYPASFWIYVLDYAMDAALAIDIAWRFPTHGFNLIDILAMLPAVLPFAFETDG